MAKYECNLDYEADQHVPMCVNWEDCQNEADTVRDGQRMCGDCAEDFDREVAA